MTFFDKESIQQSHINMESQLDFEQLQEEEFQDWGFEKPDFAKPEIFTMKNFQMVDFPSDEQISFFQLNQENIVALTASKRIFRWRFNDEPGCVEVDLPDEDDQNIGKQILKFGENVGKQIGTGVQNLIQYLVTQILTVGNVFLDTMSKPFFKRKSTVRLRLKKAEAIDSKLDKIFLEPTGNHLIISSDQGDNFHLTYEENQLRILPNLQGKILRHVIWSDQISKKAFQDILIVTIEQKFYLYSLQWNKDKEQYFETLTKIGFQLLGDRQISAIQKVQSSLIISTDQSILVLSGAKDFEGLLTKFKDPEQLRKVEIPQPKSFGSMIDLCYSRESQKPQYLIWTNGHSIHYYKFPDQGDQVTYRLLEKAIPVKYAKKYDQEPSMAYSVSEQIYGIGITAFHYYILTFDCITIISLISQKVVQYFDLSVKTMGKASGMQYDDTTMCFWVYCQKGVYKLNTEEEDMEAWKLLIENRQYVDALFIANKYNSPFYKHISGLYADDLFAKKQYIQAAKMYEKSSRSFEEIFLLFHTNEDPRAIMALECNINIKKYLRDLLKTSLFNHQKQVLDSFILELMIVGLKSMIIKTKLVAWEHELDINMDGEEVMRTRSNQIGAHKSFESSKDQLYVFSKSTIKKVSVDKGQTQINDLQEMNEQIKEEIEKFLEEQVNELEEQLVYQTLLPHGIFSPCISFAQIKVKKYLFHKNSQQNLEQVVTHYIHTENYSEAVSRLRKSKDPQKILDLIIKFSFVLMKFKPAATFDIVKDQVKTYDPSKLIGPLLNVGSDFREVAINFLEHCVYELHSQDKIINNLLIFYLTDPIKLDKLMQYLHTQETMHKERNKINFDLQFALRIFKNLDLPLPQISIQSMMGNYENAVNLALKKNLLSVAKVQAGKCEDEDEQKALWMMIAKWLLVSSEENIKEVVQLTRETDCLKVEDILPYLTESIKLEHFKSELCDSLKNYNDEIEKLKFEMNGFYSTQDSLKRELHQLKNRCIIVPNKQKCQECYRALFVEDYVVFGCLHSFHRECLWQNIKENQKDFDRQKISRLHELYILFSQSTQYKNKGIYILGITQIKIEEEEDSFFSLFTSSKEQPKSQNNKAKNMLLYQKEFDALISEQCIYCGSKIVDSILLPLDDDDEREDSWAL